MDALIHESFYTIPYHLLPRNGEQWQRLPKETILKFTRYVKKDKRVTVPTEVMNALGIKEGDIVEFTVRKVKSPVNEDPMKGQKRRD